MDSGLSMQESLGIVLWNSIKCIKCPLAKKGTAHTLRQFRQVWKGPLQGV